MKSSIDLLAIFCLAVAGLVATTLSASETQSEKLLLSAEELVELPRDNMRLIDVRSDKEYEQGHLPDAVWVDINDWKRSLLKPDGLSQKALWSDRLGKLGITPDTHVVVYGGQPTDATRAWWTLKYLGVKTVSVLDGGFDAWIDAGAHVTQAVAAIETTDFTPEFQQNRLATIDEVQSILDEGTATIIDTRSEAEYSGTGGPGSRRGHIPGAVHQEWTNFVTEDGRFKPVDEIRALLKEKGLRPQTKAVTHCQTGGRASLNAFAMELAGYGPVKNFYCGWSEWSTADDAPVE